MTRKIPPGYEPLITLTDAEAEVLRDAPLGPLPSDRWQSGGYPMLSQPAYADAYITNTLLNLWASWYALGWRLANDDALVERPVQGIGGGVEWMPASPWRRERLVAMRDGMTRALGAFLSDYVLLSCFGEARHYVVRRTVGNGENRSCLPCYKVHDLNGNWTYALKEGYRQPRQDGADNTWGVFANRGAAWDFLFHTNIQHRWSGAVGGVNWGWLAGLGRVMDAATRMDNLDLLAVTIDSLAFSHHAGSNFVSPRFNWCGKLFNWGKDSPQMFNSFSFQSFLGWKQVAADCCWGALTGILRPEVVPERWQAMPKMERRVSGWTYHLVPPCGHASGGVQKLEDQNIFINAVAIYLKPCPRCGVRPASAEVKCENICMNGCANTCHLDASTCPKLCPYPNVDGSRHTKIYCPGTFCEQCKGCHGKAFHPICAPCTLVGIRASIMQGWSTGHKRCRKCWTYAKCPSLGGKICVSCKPEWQDVAFHEGRLLPTTQIAASVARKAAMREAARWRCLHPTEPRRSWADFISTTDAMLAPPVVNPQQPDPAADGSVSLLDSNVASEQETPDECDTVPTTTASGLAAHAANYGGTATKYKYTYTYLDDIIASASNPGLVVHDDVTFDDAQADNVAP